MKLKAESGDTSAKILHVENRSVLNKIRRNENSSSASNYPQRTNNNKAKRKFHFIKCHHCGRKGHLKNDCYYFKRNSDRNRTVQAVVISKPTTVPEDVPRFAFMAGEYGQSIHRDKITFLLDSGASDHIINRAEFFTDYINLLIPIKISVAKVGEFILATKRGSIKVTSDVGVDGVLEDVLFCPDVPYNLLAVSKIQKAGMG